MKNLKSLITIKVKVPRNWKYLIVFFYTVDKRFGVLNDETCLKNRNSIVEWCILNMKKQLEENESY